MGPRKGGNFCRKRSAKNVIVFSFKTKGPRDIDCSKLKGKEFILSEKKGGTADN